MRLVGNRKGTALDEGGFPEAGSQCFLSACHQAVLSWALSVSYFYHSITHTICDICYGTVSLSAQSWFITGCLSLGVMPPAWRAAIRARALQAKWLALLTCGELKEKTVMSQPVSFPQDKSSLKIASKL